MSLGDKIVAIFNNLFVPDQQSTQFKKYDLELLFVTFMFSCYSSALPDLKPLLCS